MTEPYLIGIDSGTQSVRVMVFDQRGNIVSTGVAQHAPYHSLQPGWAEQHPEDIWDKFCQACRQAMSNMPARAGRLLGAGLSAQRNTYVFADADGRPLRPLILWLDERQTAGLHPDPAWEPWLQQWQLCSKPNWVRVNQPDIHQKTRWYLPVSGWLTFRLTGELTDSLAMHVGRWPLDVDRLAFADAPAMYEALGISRDKLASIQPPATVLGRVTREAAEQTGLPVGLPIVATAGDKQCETLGSGAITSGRAAVTYGTLAGLSNTIYDPIHAASGEYYLFPSAVSGAWNPEFQLVRGYWLVTWFREQFCRDLIAEGSRRGVPAEVLLNEEAAHIPPGADGLIIAPWWFCQTVSPNGKGAIIGLDGVHTRAHLFRALVESIAFGLRPGLELFARDQHTRVSEVMVGGGGAKSDLAMQTTADVFGLPAHRLHTVETCALGCAIDAAVATGLYGSFPDAVAQMTRTVRTFDPIPENCATYDRLYTSVYSELYTTLENVFINLKTITGR